MSAAEQSPGGPPLSEEDAQYYLEHEGRLYEELDISREVVKPAESQTGGDYDTLADINPAPEPK